MKFETAIIVILLLVCVVVIGGLAWDHASDERDRLEQQVEELRQMWLKDAKN